MKHVFPLLIVLIVLSAGFYILSQYDANYKFSILMSGNALMFLLAMWGAYKVSRKIAERPHAFVQAVYAATLLKLMVCMAGMLTYILIYRSQVHKPTVFILMGIYAVYTLVETIWLSAQAKKVKEPKS